jgi:hypothetical protein
VYKKGLSGAPGTASEQAKIMAITNILFNLLQEDDK